MNLTGVVQWLRLALSKGPNRGSSLPHLRAETDPVSETLCFLISRISDDILEFLFIYISLYFFYCLSYLLSSFIYVLFIELPFSFLFFFLMRCPNQHHLSWQDLMLIFTNTSRCHKHHYNDRFIFSDASYLKWDLQRGGVEVATNSGADGVSADVCLSRTRTVGCGQVRRRKWATLRSARQHARYNVQVGYTINKWALE
jgi:hypothetical protein